MLLKRPYPFHAPSFPPSESAAPDSRRRIPAANRRPEDRPPDGLLLPRPVPAGIQSGFRPGPVRLSGIRGRPSAMRSKQSPAGRRNSGLLLWPVQAGRRNSSRMGRRVLPPFGQHLEQFVIGGDFDFVG